MRNEFVLERPGATLAGGGTGSDPEVLLLHAGGETRAVWLPVMDVLSRRGYASVAFDQRGHGKSGGSAADGVIAFGEDAKAMISRMGSPLVVGASLGGIALMLALEELEARVSGLVLVDVVPAPDPERTRAYLAPRGGLGASPLVEDILARADHLTGIVSALRLPILLICGGLRSPLGPEQRDNFARISPRAEIRVVENAGHLVARDAPAELANLIADFAGRLTNKVGRPIG